MKAIILLVALIAFALSDVYLHVPRGSNNRLNEANTNRNNNNRLFDSQNNAKGGYCYGPQMNYYEGSLLSIVWTAQHGCGNAKQECTMVLQYMCSYAKDNAEVQVRDGTTTTTPPTDATYKNKDSAGNYVYGMHESYNYYQWCQTRSRNNGLYIADRNVGTKAVNTRQNNNGGRSGFECPEERDYYPYWHPSPWKDIAVLTDRDSLCPMLQSESQNVKSKSYCKKSGSADNRDYISWAPQVTKSDCESAGNTWVEYPAWGIKEPECLKPRSTRDNHLGNSLDGNEASFNWTLPDADTEDCVKNNNCSCVFRLRYNISTYDFEGYVQPFTDWTMNGKASPLTQDPDVTVDGSTELLQLAIDTSQFARTFEDRSYVFGILKRPSGVSGSSRIFNLNVKGKRGNIVQAYPATEYDYHPNHIENRIGDYVHFQWTGCDTNPAGNAGEGQDGTDRSNLVEIESLGNSVPASSAYLEKNSFFATAELRKKFAFLDQTGCVTTDNDNDPNNCKVLNKADRYFDGGLLKMNNTGTYYYMSSRNNNFTNRGQKGSLTTTNLLPGWAIGVVGGGAGLFALSGAVGVAMFYAKTHPHSGIANMLAKI